MNVYTYLDLELTDRNWSLCDNGQSVFYEHPHIDLYLEPLGNGTINVLNKKYKEIKLITDINDLDKL